LAAYGKIIIRMKTPLNVSEMKTPRLIPTLVAGFNTVASHIELILLPLIVDLVLWLGPKIKIDQLEKPFIDLLAKYIQSTATADTQAQIADSIVKLRDTVGQINLISAIRTIPVGIPSLLARKMTVDSPLKNNFTFEAPTAGFALLVILGLTLLGFFLGTIYFNTLSRYTVTPVLPQNNKKLFAQFGQNLVTALILLALIMIILIPGTTVLAAASLINTSIGQILVMTALILLLWLSVPLIFAPHGIFVLDQKAYPSMLLSVRMVRYFLPGAGTFLMTAAVISEGLNMLWVIPDANSWLTLVGIFGHSFVVTALLAASFIYYRGGLKWMQESIQNISDPNIRANLGGPFGSK
jgi:hypothetical protein